MQGIKYEQEVCFGADMTTHLRPIQVFYDGDCSLCRRQARHWMKHNRRQRLEFVDITDPDFRTETHGLDPKEVQQSIHVKTADGRVFQGMEGVRVIWSAFPEMWVAAFLSGLPGIRGLLGYGYGVVARNRHRLGGVCG
jgi:predicted DCC family thiol-disulfide oxidoreductase YuxK